jgi:membrane-associated phospholipid phosphatase
MKQFRPSSSLIHRCPIGITCKLAGISAIALWSLMSRSAGAQNYADLPDSPLAQTVASNSAPQADVEHNPAASPKPANSAGNGNDQTICGITHIGRCIKDLAEDDKGIFTSPLRVRTKDAYWIAPLGAATGLAFAFDTNAEAAEGFDKGREDTANTISDFGSFYASGAEGAAIYFIGLGRHNPKLAETGRLAAEAVIDSGTVVAATKLVTNRERPIEGDHQGGFWTNGTGSWHWDSSFPSDHAAATMALARVIAGEYPRWYVAAPAYTFAETISVARILANAHFPSDVVVGQAIGFLTGGYVLHHRALYCCGNRQSISGKIMSSIDPITDPGTRTVGASIEIPLAR